MKRKHLFLVLIVLLFNSVKAEDRYIWGVPGNYEGKYVITAQILLDGVELQSDDIELGAFLHGETDNTKARGSARVTLMGTNNQRYRVQIEVYGISANDANSTITFKIYNHGNPSNKDYIRYDATYQDETYDVKWSLNSSLGKPSIPLVLNFHTTTELDIVNYGTGTGNWHLIASPLNAAETNPNTVTNMLSNDYDLYYFDQTGGSYDKEWINYKESSSSTNPGFKLVPGKGYLYANSGDGVSEKTTLTFIGAPYNGTGVVELSRATTVAHDKMKGWNLIGNSFTTAKTVRDRSYYRMNGTGTELITGTGSVGAMEGIFVYAENDEETVTFSDLSRANEDDMVMLNLNGNKGNTIDRVIVRFDEGGTLPKYTLRDNSTIIYIPQADRDYAVVKGSATNVFPVNFKTEDFGTYTISSDIAGDGVSYMHLIDKITGEDIDMLLEGEYSFVAAPVDREDRFILRLNYSGYFDDNDVNNFAYQNGSDIVVCGEGTLQVFDVMGRFVSSYEINGVQTIHALPMGVYIFRMVGDDIRTQKIYVR